MKLFFTILIVLAVVSVRAQINYESSGHSVTIFPYSLLTPVTTVYPDSVISDLLKECGTPDRDTAEFYSQPWIANNQYLFDFLDSLDYPLGGALRGGVDTYIRYKVPVKFWVYRDDNGNFGISLKALQVWIDRLNSAHKANNTGIRFYQLDDVVYINDSDLINVGVGAEFINMINLRHLTSALNIHVVNKVNGEADAYFTPVPKRAVFVQANNDASGRS